MTQGPVLVEITRGTMVESSHCGHVAVVDHRGHLVSALGDPHQLIYPRSSLKFLQALPLIETGAADAFELSDERLALACASHSGEEAHAEKVRAWLQELGLGEEDLELGIAPPMSNRVALAHAQAGLPLTKAYNACSGKHAGFMTTALHLGEPVKGYSQAAHPVQQRVAAVLDDLTHRKTGDRENGIDGCNVPVWGVEIQELAGIMAQFARPSRVSTARAEAMTRLVSAVQRHPWCLAGTHRFDTKIIELTAGAALVKMGAEGVHVGILPRLGLGVAIKINDGAGRASEVAMATVLQKLGVFDGLDANQVTPLLLPEIQNQVGLAVGEMRATQALGAIGRSQ
ncbi:MAG: asparaginase [Holosporales bacterium]